MLRALVDRAIGGDVDAFDALVRATAGRSLEIACRILRDSDLAEDAVQASYITAWRQLSRLRDPDRFEPWLHRILAHACFAEARRRARWAAEARVLPIDGAYGRDETLTVHDRDQLERAFLRLPPEQRAVLVFHHYLGLSVADVADRLDIPFGTAKSRLHHGTAALRASLEADARTPTRSQERLA